MRTYTLKSTAGLYKAIVLAGLVILVLIIFNIWNTLAWPAHQNGTDNSNDWTTATTEEIANGLRDLGYENVGVLNELGTDPLTNHRLLEGFVNGRWSIIRVTALGLSVEDGPTVDEIWPNG